MGPNSGPMKVKGANTLNCRSAGTDDGHRLAFQTRQTAIGIATRVIVIPAAGMKGVSDVVSNSRDAWQLGSIQRTVGHDHVARFHGITLIGPDHPTVDLRIPAKLLYFGLETDVVIQVIVAGNLLAVGEDVDAVDVLLGGI